MRCRCFGAKDVAPESTGTVESVSKSSGSAIIDHVLCGVSELPDSDLENGKPDAGEEPESSPRYPGDFVDWDYPWPKAKRMESTRAGVNFWDDIRRAVEIEFSRKDNWDKLVQFSNRKIKSVKWHRSVEIACFENQCRRHLAKKSLTRFQNRTPKETDDKLEKLDEDFSGDGDGGERETHPVFFCKGSIDADSGTSAQGPARKLQVVPNGNIRNISPYAPLEFMHIEKGVER